MFVTSFLKQFDTHLLFCFKDDHDDGHIDHDTCGIRTSIDLVGMPRMDPYTWSFLLHKSSDRAETDGWHNVVVHTVLELLRTLDVVFAGSSLLVVDT